MAPPSLMAVRAHAAGDRRGRLPLPDRPGPGRAGGPAAELRDNLVWAHGRIIADDPESIARGEESDDVAHLVSNPWTKPPGRARGRSKLANEGLRAGPADQLYLHQQNPRAPGRRAGCVAFWPNARIAARSPRTSIAQRPVLGHPRDRLRPGARYRLPRVFRPYLGRERRPCSVATPLPVNLRPAPDAAAASAHSAVASSASSATRRRSSACVRAFIEGSSRPSSIARISPSMLRRALGQLAAPRRRPGAGSPPAAGSTRRVNSVTNGARLILARAARRTLSSERFV